MSIKIKTGKIKGYPSIIIHGDIVGQDSSKIHKVVNTFLKKGVKKLIIDLGQTQIIDSYGLGAFVCIWRQFEDNQSKLIFLCHGNFDLTNFSSSNLDKLFTIATSLDQI